WIIFITLVWLNSYTNSSCGSRTIWEGSLNYTSTLTSRVSIRLSYPLMLGSFWETSWFAIWSLGNNCCFWVNLATSWNSYIIFRCNLVIITFTINMNSYRNWGRFAVIWIWISYSYFASYILTSLTKVRFLSPFNC